MRAIVFHELLHAFNILYLLIDCTLFSIPYLLFLVVDVFDDGEVVVFKNINDIRTSCILILLLERVLLVIILIHPITYQAINYFRNGFFVFIFLDDGLGRLMFCLQYLIVIPFHQVIHILFLLSDNLLYFLNLA